MEGVGAREDEIGALADSERARAVAEEAPDFAGGAAQRLIRRHAGGDEIRELGLQRGTGHIPGIERIGAGEERHALLMEDRHHLLEAAAVQEVGVDGPAVGLGRRQPEDPG